MKITKVTVYRYALPTMREGSAQSPIFLEMETDEGLSGVGELGLAYGAGARAAADLVLEFARGMLIGRDPFATEALQDVARRGTFWGHTGGPLFGAALSALDQAMWDLKGRALGLPVHKLLGGPCRETLRVYCNGWYRGLAAPEAYAEAAARVVDAGYDALKFDPMKLDAAGVSMHLNRTLEPRMEELAVRRVEAVRAAIGPKVDLMIELHGSIWPIESIRFAHRIAETTPFFLEEVADADDPAAAREVGLATGMAIAGGERLTSLAQFRQFFEARAYGIAQPDVGLAGGFTGTRAIAALAHAFSVYIQPHNCGGPIATAAAAHLSFSIPNFLIQEVFPHWPEDDRLDLVEEPLERKIVQGRLPLPEAPGLGMTFNPALLKRCEQMTT
jgi:galactonate dehydratase